MILRSHAEGKGIFMNNQQYRQPEMEINLKEVIWDLLEQWKAILLVAVLTALLVSGVKYYSALDRYKAAHASNEASVEEAYASTDEHVAAILSELSDEDHNMVQLVLQQEAWLDNQTDYFNNSLLLSLDPNAQRQLTISYYLYDANDNSYSTLCDAYISNLKEETFANAISKQLQLKAEEKYVKELIRGNYTPNYTSDSSGELLNVVISLPENADAAELEKEISGLMSDYSKELSEKIAEHKIKLIKTDDTVSVNENAASKRTSTINSINSLNTSIANNKMAMNDVQKAAYEKIVALKELDVNDNAQPEEEPEILTKPRLSKKFAVLGFLLGAMAYAFAYLVWLILRGRINYASDVENYTGSRLLGEIHVPRESARLRSIMKSKAIEKIRYKNRPDEDSQIANAVNSIAAMCKKEEIKSISNIDLTALSEDIIKTLKTQGVKQSIIDASKLEESDLLNIKNAIVTIGKNTKLKDLDELLKLCQCYNVNILGSVFVGEL